MHCALCADDDSGGGLGRYFWEQNLTRGAGNMPLFV